MSHLNSPSNFLTPTLSLDCFSWLSSKRVEAEWTILCPKPSSDLANQIVLSDFHFSNKKCLFLVSLPRTQTISRRPTVIHRAILILFSGCCYLSSHIFQPHTVFLAVWISTHVCFVLVTEAVFCSSPPVAYFLVCVINAIKALNGHV